MISFIKQHWFGVLLSFFALVCLLVCVVVAVAPHNDMKMRGFAPCTYDLAQNISVSAEKKSVLGISKDVVRGYGCYMHVMGEGLVLWLLKKQATPWENYLFSPISDDVPDEMSEPLSDDLLKANMLDDENDDNDVLLIGKESSYEQEK